MAPKIVKPPRPRRVKCNECRATIEYLPEDVSEYHGTDYGGGPDGYRRVKCPRVRCKGYGYIEQW
jgi:hypothetical protein